VYDKPDCLQGYLIFLGKEPQVLYWAGLGVIRVKTAIYNTRKGKGKAITLQAWTGPEVSRRSRLPDFKIIGT